MRTVTYRLADLQRATIPIGFEGENEYTRVILDCKNMFNEEPTYVPALSITAPTGEKYPGVVTREGDNVYWDVSSADLPAEGYGEIQLAFVKGTQIGKTWVAKTHVNRSIIPSGTAPTPIANFIIEASAIVAGIPQAINEALQEAKDSGEFDGEDGFSPVVEITSIQGGYRISITDAEGTHTADVMNGQNGDDGYSPTVSITNITGGHRITITDKNGDHSADVMDGEDGDDGISPTVAITEITGGHRVTITDANGDHVFDVLDGYGDTSIIAPDYSDLTFPVAEGSPCVKDNVLYFAKEAIQTSEPWTASHWLAAPNVGTELTSLKNALSKNTENTNISIHPYSVGELFWYNGTLHVATSAIAVEDTIVDTGTGANCKDTTISEALIKDVQINGVSILTNGVANVPKASNTKLGAIRIQSSYGISINNDGDIYLNPASDQQVKQGSDGYRAIVSLNQHKATFYGIAKVAGNSDQSSSNNAVGTYTEDAKSKISDMLNAPETVSGTTPVITAKSGIRYICGECATLDITAPASGIIDVVFESGSTPTVLTVTPPTGITAVKWANGFDPTSLEANTKYEISIMDGELGAALSWT